MRRYLMTLVAMGAVLLAWTPVAAQDQDMAAVMRVAAKSTSLPSARVASGEPRWLKVAIFSKEKQEDKLSLNLPLRFVELVVNAMDDPVIDVDDDDIDLKLLMRELKKLGPSDLIEIESDDGVIKVWLE